MGQLPQTPVNKPWLGCIADDYTGATDLASFLVAGGLRTIQINGLPDIASLENLTDVDAIVIALKSRTIEVENAVSLARASLTLLQQLGCEKFYFKYCSTFDSTHEGNIGPVIDALMADLSINSTILCPALPVNGRTVYQGQLFVFDQLLHESPMKDHPLTPMRDSSLVRMIEKQGQGRAVSVPYHLIEQGPSAIQSTLTKHSEQYRYLIVDSLNEQHLANIGQCLKPFTLVTGGSGLAQFLGAEYQAAKPELRAQQNNLNAIKAPTLVLSGSCSSMTQTQVAVYASDHPHIFLDIEQLMSGEQSIENIIAWLLTVKDSAPIVSATASPEQVLKNQARYGAECIAEKIETTLSAIAMKASEQLGFRNFVVAGGETSGAVVNALNITKFYIGNPIAPGVPMVQTIANNPLNLALKSGNFGDKHFFEKAVEALSQ